MTHTVHLPADVESFVRETIAKGHHTDSDSLIAEALRSYAQTTQFLDSSLTPETIRAVREAAEELDRDPSSAVPIEHIVERFRLRRESSEKLTA